VFNIGALLVVQALKAERSFSARDPAAYMLLPVSTSCFAAASRHNIFAKIAKGENNT